AWIAYRPREEPEEEEAPVEIEEVETSDPWAVPEKKRTKRAAKTKKQKRESEPAIASTKSRKKPVQRGTYQVQEETPLPPPVKSEPVAPRNRFLEEGAYEVLPPE